MSKKELLTTYRNMVIELDELQYQLNRISSDGRPSAAHSVQTDRISRGTNNPGAAMLQLADGLEAMMCQKKEELTRLGEQIDPLLRNIKDYRTYIVIQHYYILAKTDEQVARIISMSKSRVNQIRMEYLRSA